MEEESHAVEEEETTEEVEYVEEEQPLEPCPVCGSEIAEGEGTKECDWCRLVLHEDCEHKQDKCPRCKRYLPSAKMKALSADRRSTAILATSPFVIIEAMMAFYSWLSHPSPMSVPDFENWLSAGLIVNTILLIVVLIIVGAIAKKGEGTVKRKADDAPAD